MAAYSALIKRLFSINQSGGIKLGLDNCLRLNAALGMPAYAYPSIHVAGTNGKGSVVTKTAAALELAGLKVGVYTSPHVACFRERIVINGRMIAEEDVVLLLDHLFSIAENACIPATFFELTTLLAFKYFADQKVDIAVIETGLGGRLDATNILKPKLCVITSISLDHTELLGDSLEAIAYEKAGIIKPQVPVVIGPTVPFPVIQSVAGALGCPVHIVEGQFRSYNQENNAIAKKALTLLDIPQQTIDLGIKALPRCRFEVFPCSKLLKVFNKKAVPEVLVMDVAHNPEGLRLLLQEVKERFPGRPLSIVVGLSKSKDIAACLKLIEDEGESVYLVQGNNERAAPAALMAKCLRGKKMSIKSTMRETLEAALDEAAAKGGVVLVCGTFFIMAAAREALGIDEPRDSLDIN